MMLVLHKLPVSVSLHVYGEVWQGPEIHRHGNEVCDQPVIKQSRSVAEASEAIAGHHAAVLDFV